MPRAHVPTHGVRVGTQQSMPRGAYCIVTRATGATAAAAARGAGTNTEAGRGADAGTEDAVTLLSACLEPRNAKPGDTASVRNTTWMGLKAADILTWGTGLGRERRRWQPGTVVESARARTWRSAVRAGELAGVTNDE